MFDLLAALSLGYLLGSFPSAMVVARLLGHDIFRTGSGNMGAMNTARNVGWAAGVAVLLLDVAKGLGAVLLAQEMANAIANPTAVTSTEALLHLPLAAGVGAVAGHAWSAFAGLRGGKALATTLGVSLPLYPLAGLYAVLLLVSLQLLTRRTTFASLAAILVYPAIVMVVLERQGSDQERAFAILTSVLLIVAIVVIKHLRPPAAKVRGTSGGNGIE